MVECKFCRSGDVIKAGIHYYGRRRQRFLCKSCGRVFIGELESNGGLNEKP